MRILISSVLLLAFAGASLLGADPRPLPSEKALALIGGIRASAMGVDREGDLWTFERHTGMISLISPLGEQTASLRVNGANQIDADSAWGVAALVGNGSAVELFSWGAALPAKTITLSEQASAVCWVGPQTLAVALGSADHDIEVWNTRVEAAVLAMGHEKALAPKPGLVRLRSYALQYDSQRELLYVLESYSGDLKVFSIAGKLAREEKVTPGHREDIEGWLLRRDREGQAKGEAKTPSVTWFRLALDRAGTPWVVEDCDRAKSTATFVAFPQTGGVRRTTVREADCSRALAIWGQSLILYRDSGDPPGVRTIVRRLP